MGVDLGKVEVKEFADGEIYVQIKVLYGMCLFLLLLLSFFNILGLV